MLLKVEMLMPDLSKVRLFHTSVARATATWPDWPGDPGCAGCDFAEYVARKFPVSTGADYAVLEAGIVSEVFPAAELDAAVDALIAQIMKAPRPARVGCKDYARTALDMDVTGAVEFARSIHSVINSSSEMVPKAHN